MTNSPQSPLRRDAVEVVRRLQGAGFTAYWAGGCVRDMLLGIEPKDYDIATNAVPDQVAALFPGAHFVGKAFGVVRVPIGDAEYEVATFRRDAPYEDGRHPREVVFSDPVTDAQRRDFTINALFHDPLTGQTHDFVGGCADLQARVVRTVGDPDSRFREDHLRILRAVRFISTLGFTLDPPAAAAISRNARLLERVSGERIRDELTRILTEALKPGDALTMLDGLGLLPVLLPEVAAMKGQAQPPDFHPEGDVFTHTVLMLNTAHRPSPELAFEILLHDVGKPPTAHIKDGRIRFEGHATIGADMAKGIMERLRFPSEMTERVCFAIGNHMRFVDVRRMRTATLRRLVGARTFATELELHRLDCLSSHRDLENYRFLVEFRQRLADEPALPPPWITGDDVMALGIPEGREVGSWHRKAYEAQLEGRFADRGALLDWLRQEVAARRASPDPERGS